MDVAMIKPFRHRKPLAGKSSLWYALKMIDQNVGVNEPVHSTSLLPLLAQGVLIRDAIGFAFPHACCLAQDSCGVRRVRGSRQ